MPYEIMMYAALACAAISFTIALILFVNLRILTVIGDLTGRNARKEIEAMKGEGRIGSSGTAKTDRSAPFAKKKKKTREEAVNKSKPPVGASKGTEKLVQQVAPPDMRESQSSPHQQTEAAMPPHAVQPSSSGQVQNVDVNIQTSMSATEEVLQPAYHFENQNAGQKQSASFNTMKGQTIWIGNPDMISKEGTTILSPDNYRKPEEKTSFTLIKHIVVINTQESLS